MHTLAKGIIKENKGYLDDEDFPDLNGNSLQTEQKQEIKIYKKHQKEKKEKKEKEKEDYNSYKINNQLDYKEKKTESGSGKMQRVILWLRNDLRLHDNYVLDYATKLKKNKEVVPVFIYDSFFFKAQTEFMSQKVGSNRMKFIHESVYDMKKNLQAIQSDLYVGYGDSGAFLKRFIEKNKKDYENILVFQKEECSEEIAIEKKVISAMKSIDTQLKVV